MMKKFFLIIVFISTAHTGTIHIAISSNMSHAMEALKQRFYKKYPKVKVLVSMGSSGKMTAQITHGAPYQLFMSADMKFPTHLYAEGLAVTKPVMYAQGSLAIFSRRKQNFSKGIEILENSHFRTIAIANPKTAPYGEASVSAFKNATIYNKIKSKLIYGESISHTISYVLNVADIGLVAKSSLFDIQMKKFKEGVHWTEVDPALYVPIEQGIVILKNGINNHEVRAFYDFMFSSEAKKILVNFGYRTL